MRVLAAKIYHVQILNISGFSNNVSPTRTLPLLCRTLLYWGVLYGADLTLLTTQNAEHSATGQGDPPRIWKCRRARSEDTNPCIQRDGEVYATVRHNPSLTL